MGQKLFAATEAIEAVDARTFRIKLREPFGLVLESLGKPSANVPFIMPKRVAETPADKQIDDYTGSGPFIFQEGRMEAGRKSRVPQEREIQTAARDPSGTAGGKIAKVDRVEWVIIKDPQTQANALATGEIDIIEAPAYEPYPRSRRTRISDVSSQSTGLGNTVCVQSSPSALRQPESAAGRDGGAEPTRFLKVQVGVPEFYRTCFSVYPCKSPYATDKGMDFIAKPDMKRARQLLKESGYDGTPVVLLQPTDSRLSPSFRWSRRNSCVRPASPSTCNPWTQRSRSAAKKDPPERRMEPLAGRVGSCRHYGPMTAQLMNASCDKASSGWPCDPELEKLRDAFARAECPSAQGDGRTGAGPRDGDRHACAAR